MIIQLTLNATSIIIMDRTMRITKSANSIQIPTSLMFFFWKFMDIIPQDDSINSLVKDRILI